MTWRPPNELEVFLLADTCDRWPHLLPLARLLVLAPRVEPLLLRNARRHFLPGSDAALESQFWFSPLVAARGTRDLVLHLGIARVLAGQLGDAQPWPDDPCPVDEAPTLTAVWDCTREHSRHWPPEDRLERDLRYYALRGDDAALAGGLRAILAQLAAESAPDGDEARRLDLSRLAKRTLPLLWPGLGMESRESARQLARYAALALGDGGDWSAEREPGLPEALPDWLQRRLPPPLAQVRLGVEVRWDDRDGQVIHLIEPPADAPALELPSPLPGRLHVAAGAAAGHWHAVTRGTRIPVDPPSAALRLSTLDGRQWDLITERLPLAVTPGAGPPPLLLVHAPPDLEQATAIADWLRGQGIAVELVVEGPPEAGTPASAGRRPPVRSVRLWTRAGRDLWAPTAAAGPDQRVGPQARVRTADPRGAASPVGSAVRTYDPSPSTTAATTTEAAALLLRTEPVDPPAAGAAAGRLIDWLDWQRLADSPGSAALLQTLGRWWREGAIALPEAAPVGAIAAPAGQAGPDTEDPEAEVPGLLAELADPQTEPPRRLAIGDRLAELGDPRPGVGTIEIEVPLAAPALDATSPSAGPETRITRQTPVYPPAIQALLDEIADPQTTPPRRLAIGDELERLGDPRPGVGLGPDGLPDIEWVEVPGGPFIYQENETRELPTFWIARYPVTNAQFQAFIDDGGYQSKRQGKGLPWWQGLKRPKPERPTWTQANRPRTNVDWYECVAFTRWLNERLGVPEGTIRLPTELEWEKAARGEQGLVYPWGNKYRSGFANVDERGAKQGEWYLGQTTAVGMYRQGRSPYGVEDLAGTVWEWCLNKYDDIAAIDPEAKGAWRAVRGGSWILRPENARAAYRDWFPPVFRNDYRGVRLCSSVPIPAR